MTRPKERFFVTESNDRWTVRPTERQVRSMRWFSRYAGTGIGLMFGCFIYGIMATMAGQQRMGVVLACFVAVIGCGIGLVAARSIRNVALSIDTKTGTVYLGDKVLCPAGTVQAVVLHKPDEGFHYFDFLLTSGEHKRVGSVLFLNMGDLASVLAEQAAAKLNLSVVPAKAGPVASKEVQQAAAKPTTGVMTQWEAFNRTRSIGGARAWDLSPC